MKEITKCNLGHTFEDCGLVFAEFLFVLLGIITGFLIGEVPFLVIFVELLSLLSVAFV